MNSKTKGYALGIIAAATYGMNPLFALPLYADGMDTNSVLFFRYLFAIIIVGIMTHMRGHSLKLTRREFLPVAAMGILAALSSLTLFMSYHYMAAGIASTILSSARSSRCRPSFASRWPCSASDCSTRTSRATRSTPPASPSSWPQRCPTPSISSVSTVRCSARFPRYV